VKARIMLKDSKYENAKALSTQYAAVKVVEWSNDESNIRIYSVRLEILELLKLYLTNGVVTEELCDGLTQSLSSCPAWTDFGLSDLDVAQRQAIVGVFIVQNCKEIKADCEVNIPLN
jgi:hypothetical protein